MIKYRDSEHMAEEHVDWFLKIIRPILIGRASCRERV